MSSTPEPFLSVENVEAVYGGVILALRGVSLAVDKGAVVALLGPNGAGKSTTFNMMCGLLRPTSGLARVAGHDLYRAAGAARARLGYMAQKFSLYGDLSVRQNLNFFAGVYGLKGKHRREAAERVTTVLGLGSYLDRNAGELPLGYKQRLALACAFSTASLKPSGRTVISISPSLNSSRSSETWNG